MYVLPVVRYLASLPELPHDAEDDTPLALRQAKRPAGYLMRRLVPQTLDELRVEYRRLLPVHQVRGRHAEDGRECRDLAHGGVGILPVLMPSTSSSVRTPALMRATSAFV